MVDYTKTYSSTEFNDALTLKLLEEVITSLRKKGYNPINQIVGYLMSGDPGYITSFEDARSKILYLERSKILEVLVKNIEE